MFKVNNRNTRLTLWANTYSKSIIKTVERCSNDFIIDFEQVIAYREAPTNACTVKPFQGNILFLFPLKTSGF